MLKTCNICGIRVEGWIYYEKAGFLLCTFCYNDLQKIGDDITPEEYKERNELK